ncbi:MAG: hypothetical protein J7555_05985 [Chloroflexi bacterium]|nr:hypothetical protein [Chloroflexota bacterium]
MLNIQIFVEDQLNEAYEILTAKAIGASGRRSRMSGENRIRAARVTLDELTDFESLLDLAQRSLRSGYQQVVFAMDHEGPEADQGRVEARLRFREAFQRLCEYIENLQSDHPLRQLRLVRVEVRSCLEAWLLSDPQAIVETFGPSDYRPDTHQTEHLTPRQAREEIAHILREIGRRKGNRRLAKMGGHAVKSLGTRIAPSFDLARARRNNRSLDYFCDMIENARDGCQQPFPELS